MTTGVLKEFVDDFRHTNDEIDLFAYLMPPNRGMGSIWVYILNMFLPFIKLREKDSFRLFCVSTKSGRGYYLHLGYKASELFEMRDYDLKEISDLSVVSSPEKFEHKIGFNYRGKAESFTLLEYPMSGNWSAEDRQQFQSLGKGVVEKLKANAA